LGCENLRREQTLSKLWLEGLPTQAQTACGLLRLDCTWTAVHSCMASGASPAPAGRCPIAQEYFPLDNRQYATYTVRLLHCPSPSNPSRDSSRAQWPFLPKSHHRLSLNSSINTTPKEVVYWVQVLASSQTHLQDPAPKDTCSCSGHLQPQRECLHTVVLLSPSSAFSPHHES
jgi:hypothetical protein